MYYGDAMGECPMPSTPSLAESAHPLRLPAAGGKARGRGANSAPPEPAPEVTLPPDECRRRREALGLSLEDLARRAGRELRTVERFEAAAVRPRPVTIVALRNALRRAEAEQAQRGDAPASPQL